DDYIICVNRHLMSRNTNSLFRRSLASNRQITVGNIQATVEENCSCYIKYDRAWTFLSDRMAKRTWFVTVFQRRNPVYCPAAPPCSIAAKTLGSRKCREPPTRNYGRFSRCILERLLSRTNNCG